MAELRIGISGWRYPPWRGVFYPTGLPQARELEYASRQMNSLEINGSFYCMQKPEYYREWYADTPPGFLFAIKGPRFITHMKQLKDVRKPLANFFASGVLCLAEKMGPILWQFPPRMRFNPQKFEEFFKMLPRDTRQAALLAREHDNKVEGRAFLQALADVPVRHAVEARHESFFTDEFAQMLRDYSVALVFADTAQRWPYGEDVTADFIYVRLHGAEQLYVSGYTDQALDWWAERIRAWRAGGQPADARFVLTKAPRRQARDVYVYFDNDAKVRAPFDAMALASRFAQNRKARRAA